jgi:hypothetical protein
MPQDTGQVLSDGTPHHDLGQHQNLLVLAQIPQDIRGFGHVKAQHSALAMEEWPLQWARFRAH